MSEKPIKYLRPEVEAREIQLTNKSYKQFEHDKKSQKDKIVLTIKKLHLHYEYICVCICMYVFFPTQINLWDVCDQVRTKKQDKIVRNFPSDFIICVFMKAPKLLF